MNYNWNDVVTPLNVRSYAELLHHTQYDKEKSKFLIEGFTRGFSLEYEGLLCRQDKSRNIPFSVENATEMWRKVMKEVKLGRFARPYEQPPFTQYVQSPIGLVPKSGGQTRFIFHLSYDFPSGNGSVNSWTSEEKCTVKYKDLDTAVWYSLKLLQETRKQHETSNLYYSKSDLVSAFRTLPVKPQQCWLLVLKAYHPITKKESYFVDLDLPFGHSISCSLFQAVSDSLAHIVEVTSGRYFCQVNYLDDFLYFDVTEQLSNKLVSHFLSICEKISFPVSLEKTSWASLRMEFLGMLLDGENKIVAVPHDKKIKAAKMLLLFSDKRKATVKEIQRLAGFFNFLTKAIIPGRTFLRCMYAKYARALYNKPVVVNGKQLKDFHYVWIDEEFCNDCNIWLSFLQDEQSVCHPFVDFSKSISARKLNFASDASRNPHLGFGCLFGSHWTYSQWESGYIKKFKPSIEYLELYALVAGILIWA